MLPRNPYLKLSQNRSLDQGVNKAPYEQRRQKISSQWARPAKRGGITGGLWMPI